MGSTRIIAGRCTPHIARRRARRRARTFAVLIVTAGILFGLLPGPASALGLGDAEERLSVLEALIKHGEEESATYQSELVQLAGQITTAQGDLAEIRANLRSTTERIWASELELAEFKAQMRGRAREIYKHGGALQLIGVVLGAESMNDFVGRVAYANDLAKQDSALMQDALRINANLRKIQDYQATLERRQALTVANLETQQDNINDVFARQQVVLADLARARGEALDLVERLAGNIGAGAIASIRRVAGQGMTISYEDWARDFLTALGAPVVRNNLVVVVAWEAAEGTNATWNPLATTMNDEGATTFNTSNVRNYRSKQQGMAMSIKTLTRAGLGYEAILDGLERGAPPMETARAIQQSRWCHGCAEGGYVIGIVPAVEKYYDAYAGDAAHDTGPQTQRTPSD